MGRDHTSVLRIGPQMEMLIAGWHLIIDNIFFHKHSSISQDQVMGQFVHHKARLTVQQVT